MASSNRSGRSDIIGVIDRAENTSMMEPLSVGQSSPHREALIDLTVNLASQAGAFRGRIPKSIQEPLADLVRSMNCYYSNLIEGHDTHPIDIEKALNGEYSQNSQKRSLQLEARAHIAVQRWIDSGALDGGANRISNVCEIHRRFTDLLPEDLRWVTLKDGEKKLPVIGGEIRTVDVAVGRHVAISPGALPRFLERFESAYSSLGKSETLLTAAAAHHRFLWIHPFLDGNGRVARLMSHALFLSALDTGGLWSIARGLARRSAEYKRLLMQCDQQRRNDLDGRGNLSEEALSEFTHFFLQTCSDQIQFMESLMQPEHLRARIGIWAEEEMRAGVLPLHSKSVLDAVLFRGEIRRGEVAALLNVTGRHAQRIISALVKKQVLTSKTPKSPLVLCFPASMASRWMPGLFPEKPSFG